MKITLETLKKDNWVHVLTTKDSEIFERRGRKNHYRLLWDTNQKKVIMVIQICDNGDCKILKKKKGLL